MAPLTFGERLAAARRQAGITQAQLAARIKKPDGGGMSQYTNDLEHERRTPTPALVLQAAVLDVPTDELLIAAGLIADAVAWRRQQIPTHRERV